MADTISDFSDPILCYILSYLPTKEAVATSVLSKRWNPLWRSVTSFDFHLDTKHFRYDEIKEALSRFLLSVNSFLRGRDMEQPLHRLCLRCPSLLNQNSIKTCIEDVLRRSGRLEHLELNLLCVFAVPSVVFICKTLVVLKLAFLKSKNNFLVDLPLLKILHLDCVNVGHCEDFLQQFLSGCLNLEDLEVNRIVGATSLKEFHSLPKLVRAKIDTAVVPLEVVKNVEVLVTKTVMHVKFASYLLSILKLKNVISDVFIFFCISWQINNVVCDLQNLVHLEFSTWEFSLGWLHVLDVLRRCPKLQTLFFRIDADVGGVWPFPLTVPICISLHLQTCCFEYYRGSAFEFQFAEYIMLNANYLQTMKFRIPRNEYNNLRRRKRIIRALSSCSKSSTTCTLSFEISQFEKFLFDYFYWLICLCARMNLICIYQTKFDKRVSPQYHNYNKPGYISYILPPPKQVIQ